MKITSPVTIAVVDDHELIRQTYIYKLTFLGYKVVFEAENGKALLDQLERGSSPDICFLDINMPVMDGFETLKNITEKWPKIKILLFSMHVDSSYGDFALKLGAAGFIAKNAPSTEFIKTLMRVANIVETA